jgi:hypothetical protein
VVFLVRQWTKVFGRFQYAVYTVFQIKTTINFSKAYKYHIPLWALVNGPLQTEVVKEDKTSIQHAGN